MSDGNGTQVEQVTPYGEGAKTEQVRQMFDSIAPAYDFMNRAMTMGIDIWWRRLAVKRLRGIRPKHILDVATGTGDFAIQLNESLRPEHITGIDLSQGMLDEACRKVKAKGLDNAITFEQGDCMALPMQDGVFDRRIWRTEFRASATGLSRDGPSAQAWWHVVCAGTVHADQSHHPLVLRCLHLAHYTLVGNAQER